MRVLAEMVASLPLPLYRRLERGKEKATYHSLYFLLHDMPNPDMTSFTFRETRMSRIKNIKGDGILRKKYPFVTRVKQEEECL